jgi:hypothetical protein
MLYQLSYAAAGVGEHYHRRQTDVNWIGVPWDGSSHPRQA